LSPPASLHFSKDAGERLAQIFHCVFVIFLAWLLAALATKGRFIGVSLARNAANIA
jgi:hypothetical protein